MGSRFFLRSLGLWAAVFLVTCGRNQPYVQVTDPIPYVDLAAWAFHPGDMEPAEVWKADREWLPDGRTLIWGDTVVVWFRQRWTVPDEWAGSVLILDVNVRSGQTLYVDDEPVGAGRWYPLAVSAEKGRTYRLSIRGERQERDPGMIMRTRIYRYPAGYEEWIAARALAQGVSPREGGLLLDAWHVMRESGKPLADPGIDHTGWPVQPLGWQWRENGTAYWYRMNVTIPDTIAGYPVAGDTIRLTAFFNREGSLWVNGEQRAHFARNFGDALLTEHAVPGSTYCLAIRSWTTPNFRSNWMRDTRLVPAALAREQEAYRRLADEIGWWDRFIRVRPDRRFIEPVLAALAPIRAMQPGAPDAIRVMRSVSDELAELGRRFGPESPFVALPYLQMVRPDGITVRSESLAPRESVLRLTHPDGRVAEHWHREATRFHRHVLTGLMPDTVYSYTIGAGNVEVGPYRFRTAPAGSRPITIVSWGDSHYGPEILEAFAGRISEIRPDLVLSTGDMIGDGWYEWEWADMFLGPLRGVLTQRPMHFAVGNHDFGSWVVTGGATNPRLDERFEPTGEAPGRVPYAFSFDYGDAHIVFIDPYYSRTDDGMSGLLPGTAQRAWLEEDLHRSRERRARWLLVYVHENLNSWDTDGTFRGGDTTQVTPLLEQYDADLVLSGHAHTYMRGERGGVTYVVSGGGGASMGLKRWPDSTGFAPYDYSRYYRYHFTTTEIGGDSLVFTAHWVRTDGRIRGTLDRFILRKGVPNRN